MSKPVDPCACPLCGQANQCAMALAQKGEQAPAACWCVNAVFSAELLAGLPVQAQEKACICANCVNAARVL